MRFRLFRSGVTVAILALAVAFLVHMATYGILGHAAEQSASDELGEQRRLGQTLSRLTAADAPAEIRSALAARSELRAAEYRRWSGASPDELERAQGAALAFAQLGAFLDRLPPAARATILGDLTPDELFAQLGDDRALTRFLEQLASANLHLPCLGVEELQNLVREERPRLSALVEQVASGHARAIEQVAQAYPDRAPVDLLATPPERFLEVLRASGFEIADADLPSLADFARRTRDLERIGRVILAPRARAAIARETRWSVGEVSLPAVVDYVDDGGRAEWFAETLRAADPSIDLTGARVEELFAAARRRQRLLAAVGETGPEETSAWLGLPQRTLLLVGLSFLVCLVGVANAMLMSVTERFTEIATMKCLGALDRFVMLMFVYEAMIQGLIGGIAGGLLGVGLALLRGLVEYGTLLGGATNAAGPVALSVVVALGAGVLLAALAAVVPAWVAARLAPMEAMRVQ
jgi:putative ABC transport system permease protein